MAAVGVLVTIYSGFLIAAALRVPFWNTALIPVL
jgi:formate-dependent nitrite reductase membrane component NrfD